MLLALIVGFAFVAMGAYYVVQLATGATRYTGQTGWTVFWAIVFLGTGLFLLGLVITYNPTEGALL